MTLQDWGAIGEVVGALAVVVTLIYLAKQIRQNTHAMEEGRRRLALAQTYLTRLSRSQGSQTAGRVERHHRRGLGCSGPPRGARSP